MKTRKALELTFPSSFIATVYVWDNLVGLGDFKWLDECTILINVQRRSERAALRAEACYIYKATARTLIK